MQEPGRDDRGEPLDPKAEIEEPLGVSLGVPLDLPQRAVDLLEQEHVAPVAEQAEAEDVGLVELKPEPPQLELGDDLGPEQARDERARGPLRACNQLFGHAGATDHVARLDDQHPLAGAGEIVGSDETVVSGPNNDRVVAVSHSANLPFDAGSEDRPDRRRVDQCLESFGDRLQSFQVVSDVHPAVP